VREVLTLMMMMMMMMKCKPLQAILIQAGLCFRVLYHHARTQRAYMMPGMYPKIVRRRHIQNSIMQPYFRNTPRGGKRMAIRMSQHVAKTPPFPMMTIASSSNESGSYNKQRNLLFPENTNQSSKSRTTLAQRIFFCPKTTAPGHNRN
jgi:hypothetical protein